MDEKYKMKLFLHFEEIMKELKDKDDRTYQTMKNNFLKAINELEGTGDKGEGFSHHTQP